MNWELAAHIAQVLSTLVVGLGVIVSLRVGLRTVRNAEAARIQSVRPELYFEYGGHSVACEEGKGGGIPGIDWNHAQEFLKARPKAATQLSVKQPWTALRNHGSGSALNTKITFLCRTIKRNGQTITLSDSDLKRFPFHPALNSMPSIPSHVPAQKTAKLSRLPTPLVWDYSQNIEHIGIVCLIEYQDIFKNRYRRAQQLDVWVHQPRDHVVFTFGHEIDNDDEVFKLVRNLESVYPLPAL